MIRNQWYVVLSSRQVKPGAPVGVTRLGEKLVFWRDQSGRVHALQDDCPHRGAALSGGKVVGDQIQCPFHGFEFNPDGRCTYLPAIGRDEPVPKQFLAHGYPTYEAHGLIFMFWGSPPSDPGLPSFFDNLDNSFTFGEAIDPWQIHYSRVIENQLDVAHLPFIHRTTIGRGNRTVVDGPVVDWNGPDRFKVFVFNRSDDGQPPRSARELDAAGREFHLEFIFPNLWQNYIGPDVRVLAAFVPVDEDRTLLYLRFYQRFLRLPLIGALVSKLAMPFNVYIAHQDRVVVETQFPRRSQLRSAEKLIQADQPIIAYRRRREELIQQAQNLTEPSTL